MNQILITDKNQAQKRVKKYKEPRNERESIVRTFAIIIIIFGLALLGNGSYSMAKEIQLNKNKVIPTVTTQKIGKAVKLSVETTKGVRTVSYSWNGGQASIISGSNRKLVEQTIAIPTGTVSKLNISVVDSDGIQTKYVRNFMVDESDIIDPEIEFVEDTTDASLIVRITDDVELSHVTYKYGDNGEETVYATEDSPAYIEIKIPIASGQQTLQIEAVDAANNVKTISQEIKGVKRPVVTLNITPDSADTLIIDVKSEENLQAIVFYINGQEYKTDPNTALNTKEFIYYQHLDRSIDNEIIVRAYDINMQMGEEKVTLSAQR